MPSNSTVDKYLKNLSDEQREIAYRMRQLILENVPDVRESIKWGRPVYELNGLLCYIADAKDHMTLGFYYGAYFRDPDDSLEGEGKQLRHLRIRDRSKFDENLMTELLKEAVRIDTSR